MNAKRVVAVALAMVATMLTGVAVGHAAGAEEKKGWGIDDPYNKLYNVRDFEKFNASVVRLSEVTPMPGMSPATAMEVRNSGETILVHLCPAWFAKAVDVGVKPGDKVTVKGCWAEIGGKDVFLASKVKKGESFEFKVRLTRDGTPFWTMTPEQLAIERSNTD
jgi:hypothetical protein